MFTSAQAAGLTPADIVSLIPVSRQTASSWLNDHSQPHPLIYSQVCDLLRLIGNAVAAGDLPLREARLPRVERNAAIKAVLAKHAPKA